MTQHARRRQQAGPGHAQHAAAAAAHSSAAPARHAAAVESKRPDDASAPGASLPSSVRSGMY